MGSIVVIPPDAGIDGGQRTQPLIDPRSASRSLAAHKFRGNKISSLRLLLHGSARNSVIPPWLPRGILPYSLQGVLCCVTLAFGELDTILSMPRYYVHFRDGSSLFKDEVGEVFADASLPLRFAIAPCQEDRPRTGAGRRGAGCRDRRGRGRSAPFRSAVVRTGQLRRARRPASRTPAPFRRDFRCDWVSSNPLHGEYANPSRPRSARAGRRIAAHNRAARKQWAVLKPQALLPAQPPLPIRRQRGRRESRDAIARPPPSGSQSHRLQLLC